MKKIIYTLIFTLLLVFTFNFFSAKSINANNDLNTKETVLAINEIFNKYYNNGEYRKDTTIYVDGQNISKDFFHAGHISLVRRTYYSGDKLWMTDINDDLKINSGYGTSENGHLTHFIKDTDGKTDINITEIDYLPGMEEYYLTLHDFVAGVHNSDHSENQDLNLADGWTYANGIYTNSNVDLIEGFRLFTAPLFLKITEENKNYFSFSHVTVEVDSKNNLVMSLFVDADNKGLMTSELVDGHYLFSQAVISCYDYPALTYGGTYSGTATYDVLTGTYSFKCNFAAVWNRVSFTYDGKVLNPQNTKFEGLFNTTSTGATWTEVLYSENNVEWLVSKTGGYNYLFTYNPTTNTLTADTAGLVWGGTWNEVGQLNDNGEYVITKAFKQWNRATLTYDGVLLTLDDLTVTGAFSKTSVVGKLYHEEGKFYYGGTDGQVFTLTFNPTNMTLNIEAVKEDLGFTYITRYNGTSSQTPVEYEAKRNQDGTYTINFQFSKAWGYITFVYNGTTLDPTNTTYNYDGLPGIYVENGSIMCNNKAEALRSYVVTYDPVAKTLTMVAA